MDDLEQLERELNSRNWYLYLERCHICEKPFTEEDVKNWETCIETINIGPTRFAHKCCIQSGLENEADRDTDATVCACPKVNGVVYHVVGCSTGFFNVRFPKCKKQTFKK